MTETGAVGAKFVGLVTPKGFQPHGSASSSGQQRVTDVFGTSSNSRSAFQNRLQLNCYHSGRSSHVCIEKDENDENNNYTLASQSNESKMCGVKSKAYMARKVMDCSATGTHSMQRYLLHLL